MYSYKHKTNPGLRIIAFRTFIGSCLTLISSVVNLTVLMVLDGEQGWICLMCCNADSWYPNPATPYSNADELVLFSVLVLHWVTSVGKERPVHNKPNDSEALIRRDWPRDWQNQQQMARLPSPTVTTCVRGTSPFQVANINATFPHNEIQVRTEQILEVKDGTSNRMSASAGLRLPDPINNGREGRTTI